MTNRKRLTRREFLNNTAWYAGVLAISGALGVTAGRAHARDVWQIDPDKCVQCGKCATECVISPSAVKCTHAYDMCGYCKLCSGFFDTEASELNSGAENQQCPTGAIKRRYIEDPYYEYEIDEKLCVGCGICVKNCGAYGNGSLFLQIRHDRCQNCNECAVARKCPAQAFVRVPEDEPYLLKSRDKEK